MGTSPGMRYLAAAIVETLTDERRWRSGPGRDRLERPRWRGRSCLIVHRATTTGTSRRIAVGLPVLISL
jgi:hypothetical protein